MVSLVKFHRRRLVAARRLVKSNPPEVKAPSLSQKIYLEIQHSLMDRGNKRVTPAKIRPRGKN